MADRFATHFPVKGARGYSPYTHGGHDLIQALFSFLLYIILILPILPSLPPAPPKVYTVTFLMSFLDIYHQCNFQITFFLFPTAGKTKTYEEVEEMLEGGDPAIFTSDVSTESMYYQKYGFLVDSGIIFIPDFFKVIAVS